MASVAKREWLTAKGGKKSAWIVRWINHDGRHCQKTVKTKADGEKIKRQVEKCGTYAAPFAELTVEGACEIYIRVREREMRRGEIAPQRYRECIRVFEKHIKAYIGTVRLSQLNPLVVQNWVDKLASIKSGEASNADRARSAVYLLTAALVEAQRLGYATRNILKDVPPRLPRQQKSDPIDVPTTAQVAKLIRTAKGSFQLMIEVAAITGMRAGEICALKWDAIDFDERIIKVRFSLEPGTANLKRPKSRAGIRDIPVPPLLLDKLLRHQSKQAAQNSSSGVEAFVFPERKGVPFVWARLYQKKWVPLVSESDLGRAFRFHSLRHFAASSMIAANIPPKRVQYIMGHASIQMTFDRYGRLFPDGGASQAALEGIERRVNDAVEV